MFADLHTFIFKHFATSSRHSQATWLIKTVAASLIHTRITMHANSLIHGSTNIKQLQWQTSVARVVLPNLSHQPATALLSELHWLPVNSRITFKLACLTNYSPPVNLLILFLVQSINQSINQSIKNF